MSQLCVYEKQCGCCNIFEVCKLFHMNTQMPKITPHARPALSYILKQNALCCTRVEHILKENALCWYKSRAQKYALDSRYEGGSGGRGGTYHWPLHHTGGEQWHQYGTTGYRGTGGSVWHHSHNILPRAAHHQYGGSCNKMVQKIH